MRDLLDQFLAIQVLFHRNAIFLAYLMEFICEVLSKGEYELKYLSKVGKVEKETYSSMFRMPIYCSNRPTVD